MADLDGNGDPEAIMHLSPDCAVQVEAFDNMTLEPLGRTFCDSQTPNSSGQAGGLTGYGSELVTLNRVSLLAARLPRSQFAMLLGSQTFGMPAPLAGSPGLLCLNGSIGRYQGPGQILNSGAKGALAFDLALSALSLPNGPLVGLPGQTWSFQAWRRDTPMGAAISQLTSGVAVTLR